MTGFYRKAESEFYVDLVDFHLKSDQELAQIIAEGVRLYNQLYPPKSINPLVILAVVVVAVAAVAAAAAAGSTAASGAAASSTGLTAAAPGATAAASATGLPVSSTLSTIKSVAGYVEGAGKVYAKATGKNPPEKLMAAADIVGSPSLTGAVKTGVDYQLRQEGLAMAKDDKRAKAAMDVMIQREQERYSAQLREIAKQEAQRLSLPPPEPPKRMELTDALPFILPIAVAILGS